MKATWKFVVVGSLATALAATTPVQQAQAGQKERDRNAAIIGGVAVAGLITAAIIGGQSHHTAVHVSYGYPPAPPPPQRVWVPGHYELRRERVVQPGYWQTVVEPAQYAWVVKRGRRVHVEVKPECRRQVWAPERVEWQETRVWMPGRWEVAQHRYACAY